MGIKQVNREVSDMAITEKGLIFVMTKIEKKNMLSKVSKRIKRRIIRDKFETRVLLSKHIDRNAARIKSSKEGYIQEALACLENAILLERLERNVKGR